jgi:hypothetical protein
MTELTGLTPAAEQGWQVLFEVAEEAGDHCLLVGGQMMFLLAVEHQATAATADRRRRRRGQRPVSAARHGMVRELAAGP